VRQPSVSTERRGIAEYAELLSSQYIAIGCQESEVVQTRDGLPGVWAYFDAGAPCTIACYAYFDTYGADEAQWSYPPYEATRTGFGGFRDVIVGRGATVKGSHRAWMSALEAAAAVDGGLPVNVLFLTEGAEMLGSPNFDEICSAVADRLPAVDAFLSPRFAESATSRDIAVVLGYKNMVTFDLVCDAHDWGRGPAGGTIYGNSKSVVDAPTHRLVQALSSLLQPDGNGISIDGLEFLNHDRAPVSVDEERLIEGLVEHFAGGEWNSVLPTTGGVKRWVDDLSDRELLSAYLYGPSINISEIRSAGVGAVPQLSMLLPESCRASVELRLVTDMRAAEILECVRRHLDARGFHEVQLVPVGRWDSWRTPVGAEIVQATIETLELHGRHPVIWPIQPFGGPWAGVASRLGVPSLTGCALGFGANGGGAANEFLVIDGADGVAGLVESEAYMVDLVNNVGARLTAHAARV
jgi:acetylornithine deacetylase/succinyl-diaminopimelate desuccinylase-like protein